MDKRTKQGSGHAKALSLSLLIAVLGVLSLGLGTWWVSGGEKIIPVCDAEAGNCGEGGLPCKAGYDCCGSRLCVDNERYQYCDWTLGEAPYGAPCRASYDCSGSMICDSEGKFCR